jgi:hypothetical protein
MADISSDLLAGKARQDYIHAISAGGLPLAPRGFRPAGFSFLGARHA